MHIIMSIYIYIYIYTAVNSPKSTVLDRSCRAHYYYYY